MSQRKSVENGFTLIEVIITLVLVGIMAAVAGMWMVSVANGYIFAEKNAKTTQNAQLAIARIVREFTAIKSVDNISSANAIRYIRTDSALNDATVVLSKNGAELQVNVNNTGANTLADNVSAFTLAYCDTNNSCAASWASTSKIIQFTFTLTGADNTSSTFVRRVAPRNL